MILLVFSFIALSCNAVQPDRYEELLDEEYDEAELQELQELNKSLLIYYINTDKEAERRVHMETQAEKARMQMHRFKAIDRHSVSLGEFDDKYVLRQGLAKELLEPDREKDHVRNATVACYMSHTQLLEKLQSTMGPSNVAVVLEDDVEIPHNWLHLVKKALDCAPKNWSLLKVSGWGYNRDTDLWKPSEDGTPPAAEKASGSMLAQHAKLSSAAARIAANVDSVPQPQRDKSMGSAQNLMGFLQNHGGWMSKILYGDANPTRTKLMRKHPGDDDESFIEHSPDELSCPDAYLMRKPFKEQYWWHFWGPAFHYAGTGAYIVKGSSISAILKHLQNQPIDDIDGMLLSKGELRAYELWPHIFPLTTDHLRSTLLSSRSEDDQGEQDVSNGPAKEHAQDAIMSGLSSWLPSWNSQDSEESPKHAGSESGAAELLSIRDNGPPCRGVPCNTKA